MNSGTSKLALRHYVVFAVLCAIWGSTWMAISVVVRYIPPCLAASLRFFIAAAFLAIFALLRRLPLPKNKREWSATLVLSITMMALPYGLIFWAEQYISSSITAVLYASSPLVAALLTPAMTGRRVPRGAVYSLLVAVGGMAMLFDAQLRATQNTFIGGIAVLIGVVSSSWSTVYAKRETQNVHPVVSTGVQLFVGAVALLVVSLGMEREQRVDWTRPAVAALVFLAVFGSAIAFALYYWLLRHMEGYKATTINLVVPFVAIAEGSLILHEMITSRMLLAAVLVLGAVAFALKAESDEPSQLHLARAADESAE